MDQKIQTVRLVADPYPPYQYMEGGIIRGIDHDIIAASFEEHGIDMITRLFPWDECIKMLKEDKADGIFQIVRTPERERAYIFSKTLRNARTVICRRTEDTMSFVEDINFSEQLKKYRVGVVKGYSYNPLIDRLGEPSRMEVDSQEALLTGLRRGEFDLIVIDWGVAKYLANKMEIRGIDKLEGYEITRQLYVAFQRNRNHIADLFNSGLDRVKEKGIYDGIFERYGLTP
ncbi:MAG: amino acid ABC transporter substrate-binding protein [Syntrophobacterales bacterium]|nr:MAG: amino acid ABC transporter substrate-binding protein [Syntrophobacterales bacterium]